MNVRRVTIVALGTLAALAALVYGVGAALPREHAAAREVEIDAAPERIATLVRDVEAHARWRSDVRSVVVESRDADRTRYREIGADGSIGYEMTESVPGRRFRTRIVDDSLPFGGEWTIDLEPRARATRVRIEERGHVDDPLYRFFSALVFGHTATMEAYLSDLRAAARR